VLLSQDCVKEGSLKNKASQCYQFLRFILNTERRHILNVQRHLLPPHLHQPPEAPEPEGPTTRTDSFVTEQVFAFMDHDVETTEEF